MSKDVVFDFDFFTLWSQTDFASFSPFSYKKAVFNIILGV